MTRQLLYLRLGWFLKAPDKAEAMIMFEDFLATNAPLRVEEIKGPLYQVALTHT